MSWQASWCMMESPSGEATTTPSHGAGRLALDTISMTIIIPRLWVSNKWLRTYKKHIYWSSAESLPKLRPCWPQQSTTRDQDTQIMRQPQSQWKKRLLQLGPLQRKEELESLTHLRRHSLMRMRDLSCRCVKRKKISLISLWKKEQKFRKRSIAPYNITWTRSRTR